MRTWEGEFGWRIIGRNYWKDQVGGKLVYEEITGTRKEEISEKKLAKIASYPPI
jgi:hypothetical protein